MLKEPLKDLAATIHRATYGKSDKVNAPENQNPDFQAGYSVGAHPHTLSTTQAIRTEWQKRNRPHHKDQSFCEWKRGLWAASFQKHLAQ